MVQETINMTVDQVTHKLWTRVAKVEGVKKIDLLRGLVAERANVLGLKVPKALEEFI